MTEDVTAPMTDNSESTAPWYYLEASGQSLGPITAYQLAGLLDAAAISVETMVWTEGQPEWLALKDKTELYNQLYYISSNGLSVPARPLTDASQGQVQEAGSAAAELAAAIPGRAAASASKQPGAIRAARPAINKASVPTNKALAEFKAELADLGEAVSLGEDVNEAVEEAGTPPPEDQEFEDDDGTIYKWDPKLRKFQPKRLESNGEYGMEEMTFEMDEEAIPTIQSPEEDASSEEDGGDEKIGKPAKPEARHIDTEADIVKLAEDGARKPLSKGKKRGAEEVMERIAEKKRKAVEQAEAQKQWFDLKVNTSVYVTGLPDDITESQLAERFAQYGVVKPGEDGAPRVKIYRDKATQMAKGDGLVTFLYEPSVELACKLADDDHFRPGMAKKMTVQAAKFEMHGSEYVPKKKPNKKKTSKEKQKLAQKVLGWEGFDDKLKASQVTVILENLFHPDEFIADPTLLKDLDADIKEESATLGPLDKVKVFAGNPKGVVSVKFKTEEGAQACLKKMDGRFFGGRQVVAKLWDGFTNYNMKLQESEESTQARREQFAKEIEAQEIEEKLRKEQEDAAALQEGNNEM